MLSRAERGDSHPRPTAPRVARFPLLAAFASTTHLRPAPLIRRPATTTHPKAAVIPRRTSLWLPRNSSHGSRKYSLARQIFVRATRVHELGQILSHGRRHLSLRSAEAAGPHHQKGNECSPPELSQREPEMPQSSLCVGQSAACVSLR